MNSESKSLEIIQAFKSIGDKNIQAIPTFLSLDTNGNLIIETNARMLNCTNKEISFLCKGRQIYISGSNLEIRSFTRTMLSLGGKIDKIEFFEVK